MNREGLGERGRETIGSLCFHAGRIQEGVLSGMADILREWKERKKGGVQYSVALNGCFMMTYFMFSVVRI